jgi:hypothetical protein
MPSLPDLRGKLGAFARALDARSLDEARLDFAAGDAALARRRFGLYRGNVQANVARALGNAYPVVRALVGAEFFEGLANAYATAHPSSDGDLNATGAAFADFVAVFPHTADLPYLPDVARLEWLAHRAHYAADAAALDVARLGAIAPERLGEARLVLHPACALLVSPWPVATIWQVHRPAHEGEIAVDLDAGEERALVYRPAWRVEVAAQTSAAHAFLARCADGEPLAAAVDVALRCDPAFDLQAQLVRWVADAVIVDVIAAALSA